MSGKGIKKCGFIRTDRDGNKRCPFGLPITAACLNAGESTAYMFPLSAVSEEKRERVKKANQRVYIHNKTGQRCLYAANVMKEQNAVNCDFGDSAQGTHVPAISGSPLYAQTFSGVGIDGLYAFPLGFYADNNESRNLFHGLFSLVGDLAINIVKIAICEENKSIWDKLEDGSILLPEEQSRLNEIIRDCRNEFEKVRTDPAKIKELADKWNSRKRL